MDNTQENRYRVAPIGLSGAYGAVICGTGSMSVYQGEISDCERVALLLEGAFNDGKHYVITERQAAAEAAKATGTAELPSLPEGKAWASPLRYGSKIGFPKPVKPANWDDDDGVDWFCHPYFTADQMRAYGQQCAEAACRDKNGNHVSDTWQERTNWQSDEPASKLIFEAAKAEIAELRAALAATAAPVLSDEQILQMFAQAVGNENDDAKTVEVYPEEAIAFARNLLAATRSQP